MKKKKLKLTALEVQSFVTSVNDEHQQVGGATNPYELCKAIGVVTNATAQPCLTIPIENCVNNQQSIYGCDYPTLGPCTSLPTTPVANCVPTAYGFFIGCVMGPTINTTCTTYVTNFPTCP